MTDTWKILFELLEKAQGALADIATSTDLSVKKIKVKARKAHAEISAVLDETK